MTSSTLRRVFVLASLTPAAAWSADPVNWVDWTAVEPDGSVSGTILADGATISVSYVGERAFVQTSGGTNYWIPSTPYTSATVPNPPPDSDIIALRYATAKSLAFSEAVTNPLFAVVSLNGNGYRFDRDFSILSYGRGYWGTGTLTKQISTQPDGSETYDLIGSGEPHGVIQFIGTFSTVSWTSLSNEYWNGFTIAVEHQASAVPPEIAVYDGPDASHPPVYDDQAVPVDAGDVLPGDVGEVVLTLTNEGTGPLDLLGASFSGVEASSYSLAPLPAALAAGGALSLVITFAPTTAGRHDAVLSLATNDGDENPFDIPLVGRSLDADADDVPDFDDVCPGYDDALDADLDDQPDGCDVCPADPDDDLDGDGQCGDVDPCPLDPENDADGDGVCEATDSCPVDPDPSQSDVDGDGVGDVCDLFLSATGACPGAITFQAWGLTPGGPLAVIASSAPGAVAIPTGTCAGTVTGLGGQPRLLARVHADVDGEVYATVSVQASACGRWLQIVDMATCGTTNPVQLYGP